MIIYFILFIYLLWGKEKGTPSKGDSLTKLVSNDCVGEKKALWIQIGWEEIKKIYGTRCFVGRWGDSSQSGSILTKKLGNVYLVAKRELSFGSNEWFPIFV